MTVVSSLSYAPVHHNQFSHGRCFCSMIYSSIRRQVLLRSHARDLNFLIWCVYEGKAGAGQQVKQSQEGPTAAGAQPVAAALKTASKASKERQPAKKRPLPQVSECYRYIHSCIACVSADKCWPCWY